MRFSPLSNPAPLPLPGTAAEHALWELKQDIGGPRFHLAKDVAAFANHYGGTILVGAREGQGRIHSYHPLALERLAAIETTVKNAVKDLCSPFPVFNYERFARDAGWILAINVWPSISTIVGVKVQADKQACGYGDAAYVFPTRIVNHSETIDPEAFPMYMLPQLRRTLLLLYAIPDNANLVVYWGSRSHPGASGTSGWRLVEINERANYLAVQKSPTKAPDRAPLDGVRRVFRSKEAPVEEWQIFLEV